MTKSRGILAPRVKWTPYEDELLEAFYPVMKTEEVAAMLNRAPHMVYNRAARLGIRKDREFMASEASGRIMRETHRGRLTQFRKGITPWNKGKPFIAGGRSVETRFKKGSRKGRANEIWKPVGTERISRDGYLERKIHDGMPLQSRWRAVHILAWEEANGPLPKGHAIAFKDGNKQNITLENLECISRADLMRRNTYHRYGKEIAQLVQLRGALTRQINQKEGQHGRNE